MERVIFLIIPLLVAGNVGQYSGDHRGVEFIVAFIDSRTGLKHSLFMTSKHDVTVTIKSDHMELSKDITIDAFSSYSEELPKSFYYLSGMEFAVERKAIHVSSTNAISLYGTEYGFISGDGFMVIPIQHLTGHYIAVSRDPGTSPSHLVIAATQNNTVINIELRLGNGSCATAQYKNGTTLFKTINRFDVVGLSCTGDITGTVVTSDKPIAVFSGNEKTAFPSTSANSDMLVEMMIPVESFGQSYVMTNITGSPYGTSYRIVASEDNTTVSIGGSTLFTLQASGYEDIDAIGEHLLEANAPVMVVMYDNLIINEVGDAFMAIVPPTDRFFQNPFYEFTKIAVNNYDDVFVTVYFNTTKFPNITFGDPNIITPIPGTNIATLSTYASTVKASSFASQVTEVGLVIYVHPLSSVAYGYLGGMAFGFDPCEAAQCLNLGTCIPSGSIYTCYCQSGYTGPNCETEIIPPTSQPGTINPTETSDTTHQYASSEVQSPPPILTSAQVTLESSSDFQLTPVLQSATPVQTHVYSYTRIIDLDGTRITEMGLTVFTTDFQPTMYDTDLVTGVLISYQDIAPTDGYHRCLCTSYENPVYVVSEETKEEIREEIQKKLLLETTNLTKTMLKYKSVEDDRPSARSIGSVGIVMLVLVALLIIIPDVVSFLKKGMKKSNPRKVEKK